MDRTGASKPSDKAKQQRPTESQDEHDKPITEIAQRHFGVDGGIDLELPERRTKRRKDPFG